MGALYIVPSYLAFSFPGNVFDLLTPVLTQSLKIKKHKYNSLVVRFTFSYLLVCLVVCLSYLCFLFFSEIVEAWCGMDKQQQNTTVSLLKAVCVTWNIPVGVIMLAEYVIINHECTCSNRRNIQVISRVYLQLNISICFNMFIILTNSYCWGSKGLIGKKINVHLNNCLYALSYCIRWLWLKWEIFYNVFTFNNSQMPIAPSSKPPYFITILFSFNRHTVLTFHES